MCLEEQVDCVAERSWDMSPPGSTGVLTVITTLRSWLRRGIIVTGVFRPMVVVDFGDATSGGAGFGAVFVSPEP